MAEIVPMDKVPDMDKHGVQNLLHQRDDAQERLAAADAVVKAKDAEIADLRRQLKEQADAYAKQLAAEMSRAKARLDEAKAHGADSFKMLRQIVLDQIGQVVGNVQKAAYPDMESERAVARERQIQETRAKLAALEGG